jgi:DNA polymerase III delta subunit
MIQIIHGDNPVDVDDYVSSSLARHDPTGLLSTRLTITIGNLQEIRAAVLAAPFFGAERLIVLNLDASENSEPAGVRGRRKSGSDWPAIEGVLTEAPASSSVIVRHDGLLGTSSTVLKSVKQHGWEVRLFRAPRGDALLAWVAERARRHDASISPEAAATLLNHLFDNTWRATESRYSQPLNLRRLATEIEKLASACDGEVSAELVNELVEDRAGVTAFRLSDEIFRGNARGALTELSTVLAEGTEPQLVLGQVSSEIAAVFAALTAGTGEQTAATTGFSAGRLGMAGKKASGLRQEQLSQVSQLLRRAEWLVKTGRTQSGEDVIVPALGEIATRLQKR